MSRRPAQALVIVDMQVDYFSDGELERCRDDLVGVCNALVAQARAAGVPVFEVRTEHTPDKTTWALNMREDDSGMVISGTEGAATVDGLDVDDAIRVVKTRDSSFYGTDLEDLLAERGITSIVLAGVSTESCIQTTAADAYARDIRVTFVEDALASIDPELHRRTLDQLEQQYRQPVISADDVVFDPA